MRTYHCGTSPGSISQGSGAGAQGFTLVELMIVVTIIGILSMIAIPNFNDHIHVAKMTKTMEDMNRVANAWQMKGALLGQGEWIQTGETVNADTDFPNVLTARELEAVLNTEVPEIDGWGNAYEYRVDGFPATCLMIISPNSDGQRVADFVTGTMLPTDDRTTDLVRIDFRWIQRCDPIWQQLVVPSTVPVVPPPVF